MKQFYMFTQFALTLVAFIMFSPNGVIVEFVYDSLGYICILIDSATLLAKWNKTCSLFARPISYLYQILKHVIYPLHCCYSFFTDIL